MGVPIFGLNIPAPKIKISKDNLEIYANLYRGIRDREDTVSWRTLIITIRQLLGSGNPDYKKINIRSRTKAIKLIKQLVDKTYLAPLTSEIEYAVGIRTEGALKREDLDLLLISGRHYPEAVIWSLADYAAGHGKKVAVINPVGHYNDGQTRVVGPFRYFHKIKKVIILSSTQSKLGGNISVLANVIKLLRNSDLAGKTDSVEIVIPMFGGSRGHRFGQSQEVGYEVMEAGFNAQLISLITKDILHRLKKEKSKIPSVRFSSIDIHNVDYPKNTFEEYGFSFTSINSSVNLAQGIVSLVKSKKTKLPIKLVACDFGAIPRTQNLAREILFNNRDFLDKLQIVYIEKKRPRTGVVADASISKVEEWKRENGQVSTRKIAIPLKASFKNTVIVYSDDMIDTGGTAERDLSFIGSYYPSAGLKIFAATHPVFSKGFGAIKKIGADAYVLGNTLSWDGLSDLKGVYVVDFAEAIYNTLILNQ